MKSTNGFIVPLDLSTRRGGQRHANLFGRCHQTVDASASNALPFHFAPLPAETRGSQPNVMQAFLGSARFLSPPLRDFWEPLLGVPLHPLLSRNAGGFRKSCRRRRKEAVHVVQALLELPRGADTLPCPLPITSLLAFAAPHNESSIPAAPQLLDSLCDRPGEHYRRLQSAYLKKSRSTLT
jgi:hypothetical protein